MSQIAPMKQKSATIGELLESRKEQLARALPRHLTPDRLLRVSLNAFNSTPKLLDCTPASLVGAVMECATLGLEPVLGQAYLIPYGKQATFIPGYKGLLTLARRSGEISSIQVGVVYEKDHFNYVRGLKPVLEHVESNEDDRGDITHFWAVALLKDGGSQFEVMRRADVDAIRDGSPSARSKSSPWVTHYEEMGKKTVLRRLCKLLPSSVEMQRAVELDEFAESGIPQNLGSAIDITPPTDDAPEAEEPAEAAAEESPAVCGECGFDEPVHAEECEAGKADQAMLDV